MKHRVIGFFASLGLGLVFTLVVAVPGHAVLPGGGGGSPYASASSSHSGCVGYVTVTNYTGPNNVGSARFSGPHGSATAGLHLTHDIHKALGVSDLRALMSSGASSDIGVRITIPSLGFFNRALNAIHVTQSECRTHTSASDFSLSLSVGTVTLTQGKTAHVTVSTIRTSGHAGTVSLSASGMQSGVSASFNPTSVTAGHSSTLTFSASKSAVVTTRSVTVRGAEGSVSHTKSVSLTVKSAKTGGGGNPNNGGNGGSGGGNGGNGGSGGTNGTTTAAVGPTKTPGKPPQTGMGGTADSSAMPFALGAMMLMVAAGLMLSRSRSRP
jgi:hypothetical protein